MTKGQAVSKNSIIPALLAMVAMSVTAYITSAEKRPPDTAGLFILSPNLWNIPAPISCACNIILLALTAFGAMLLNRRYNFIRSTQPVMPVMFLIIASAVPLTLSYLSSATIIAATMVWLWHVLFNCHRARNATQEAFVTGTFLGIGAMFQYAFVPFIATAMVWLTILNVMRLKECIALLLGVIAPYWVVLGLGILTVDNFTLPHIHGFSTTEIPASDKLLIAVCFATTIIIGLVAGLNNEVKLFAGNSRILALNNIISVTGLTAAICMIIDYDNAATYYTTLALATAAQIANVCVFGGMKRPAILTLTIAIIYIFFFVMTVGNY